MAEKALAKHVEVNRNYLTELGIVDKDILANVILVEAAEILLAKYPWDHPDQELRGRHIEPTKDRMAAMTLLAPYILAKPEQKVSATVQTVESALLDLAKDDPIDLTPGEDFKEIEG